jgi:hypothetical protein
MSEGQGEGKEKIERSAEALRVCHHPFLFPSEIRTLQQHRASDHADKDAKDGHSYVVARQRTSAEAISALQEIASLAGERSFATT